MRKLAVIPMAGLWPWQSPRRDGRPECQQHERLGQGHQRRWYSDGGYGYAYFATDSEYGVWARSSRNRRVDPV